TPSADTVLMSCTTRGAEGFVLAAAMHCSSLAGCQRSSPSSNATYRDVDSITARFRACATPRFAWRMTLTRDVYRVRTAGVSSVEPSPTIAISSGGRVWASTDSIVSPMYADWL